MQPFQKGHGTKENYFHRVFEKHQWNTKAKCLRIHTGKLKQIPRINSTQCDKHLMSACSIEGTATRSYRRNSESSASPVETERPAEMLNAACSGRRGLLVEKMQSASSVQSGPRELPSAEEVLANSWILHVTLSNKFLLDFQGKCSWEFNRSAIFSLVLSPFHSMFHTGWDLLHIKYHCATDSTESANPEFPTVSRTLISVSSFMYWIICCVYSVQWAPHGIT